MPVLGNSKLVQLKDKIHAMLHARLVWGCLGSIRPRQILHHRLAAPEPAHLLLVLALLMMLMRNSAIRLLERLMAARSWMLHLQLMAARSWMLHNLQLMAARSWMLHLPVMAARSWILQRLMAARSWILQRLMAARSWILHLPLGLHELQVPPVAAPNPKDSPVALGEEVARAEEARRTHPGTPSAALNDAARGRPWAELQAFKPIAYTVKLCDQKIDEQLTQNRLGCNVRGIGQVQSPHQPRQQVCTKAAGPIEELKAVSIICHAPLAN